MKFIGKYRFLSNFYTELITFNGYLYQNAESAFQTQKEPGKEHLFANTTGAEAKRLGKNERRNNV